jgi:hypothetical protein
MWAADFFFGANERSFAMKAQALFVSKLPPRKKYAKAHLKNLMGAARAKAIYSDIMLLH